MSRSSADGDPLIDDRLLGRQPSVEIADAGLTPDVRTSPFTSSVRPKVMLSRLTLRAVAKDHATLAAFSFCVDQSLVNAFAPGDMLHLVRTGCGGLGLSVVRGKRLIAAVGAVTALPLGDAIEVRIPEEAIREAELPFSRLDARFEFTELPIDIRVGSERRVLYRGPPRMGEYHVFVEHGFFPGTPGTDECVALALVGACPEIGAMASAQLLEYSDLSETDRW